MERGREGGRTKSVLVDSGKWSEHACKQVIVEHANRWKGRAILQRPKRSLTLLIDHASLVKRSTSSICRLKFDQLIFFHVRSYMHKTLLKIAMQNIGYRITKSSNQSRKKA